MDNKARFEEVICEVEEVLTPTEIAAAEVKRLKIQQEIDTVRERGVIMVPGSYITYPTQDELAWSPFDHATITTGSTSTSNEYIVTYDDTSTNWYSGEK